jgi:hypothetical protein
MCMTQYILKKGLELLGTEGTVAVEAELCQLHDCKVILPINRDTLSSYDREWLCPFLCFLNRSNQDRLREEDVLMDAVNVSII